MYPETQISIRSTTTCGRLIHIALSKIYILRLEINNSVEKNNCKLIKYSLFTFQVQSIGKRNGLNYRPFINEIF